MGRQGRNFGDEDDFTRTRPRESVIATVGLVGYAFANNPGRRRMADYVYRGAADIDRAIALLVDLDNSQSNALAVLQFDQAIDELQGEYTKSVADPDYRPDDDFIDRLSGYLAMADDRENPQLN
jgi:hypothetical protein